MPEKTKRITWKKINLPRNERPEVQEYECFDDLPPIPISFPMKGSIGKTGAWRTYRPIFIQENCKGCYQCYIFCPEGTIDLVTPKEVEIDLDYCKGCGICVKMCKFDALEMKQESGCDG